MRGNSIQVFQTIVDKQYHETIFDRLFSKIENLLFDKDIYIFATIGIIHIGY